MGQSVPKRRHIKFRRQGITQKKKYSILRTQRKFEIKKHNLVSIVLLYGTPFKPQAAITRFCNQWEHSDLYADIRGVLSGRAQLRSKDLVN